MRDPIGRISRLVRLRSGLPRRVPVLVLAAVAVVAATAVGTSALSTPPPRSNIEPPDSVRDIVAVGLGRSAPVRIVIPSIHVNADIVPLGLSGEELTAPPDARRAGWYERGTSPGELGSAVIMGRSAPDRAPGPAVFARLGRLAGGDRIRVVRDDGRVAAFTVERVEARGGGCEPARRGCRVEHAPQETGAEAQLRLVSRDVVVWATLTP